jgi:hypothetical protein
MADVDGSDGSVPFWWIALFMLVSLGAAIGAIYFVGGSLLLVPPIA